MIKLFQAFPVLVAASLISAVLSLLANRNRTAAGKGHAFTPLFWRGRDNFTHIGWRYRTCAMVFAYIGFLSVVIPLVYAKL